MKTLNALFLTVMFWSFSGFAFSQSEIPGIKGPKITFSNGKLHLSMQLTEVNLEQNYEVKVPQTELSSVTLSSENGEPGTQVSLKLHLEDIASAQNVEAGEAQTLPCGRKIPGGTLKDALRVDLPEENYGLSFFYHKNLFGTYIPFNFEFPEGEALIPLKWKGSNIGAISVIGKEGNKKASGTVFLNMKVIKAHKEIQKLLK